MTLSDKSNIVPIFGGSFNPPTLSHFIVAHTLGTIFSKVLIVPSVQNPFKKSYEVDFDSRYEMCKLCFTEECMEVSGIERDFSAMTGVSSVRTYPLIEYLNEEISRGQWFVPAIGGDVLNEFNKFYEWRELVTNYGLIVIRRSGYNLNDFAKRLLEDYKDNIISVEIPFEVYTSSTGVRNDIAEHKDNWGVNVMFEVKEYIEKKNLYS